MKHIALLRGVNVGGKNRLPMAELVALVEALGATEVETYVQSGNVVFRASKAGAAQLPDALADAIQTRFGFAAPVVVRSGDALAEVVARNPYLAAGVAPTELHVAFLATHPTASAVATLEPDRSPPDSFVVAGADVYLRLPNGVARSKLTNAWLDRKLATTSTLRNWSTVLALARLAAGART